MEQLSAIAAWWDGSRVRTEQIISGSLGDWVADSPSQTRVVLATVAHTAVMAPIAIGSALVDILRLGEGTSKFAKTGNAWGLVEDGLRVLPVAGAAGRLAVASTRSLKWVMTDPNIGNCGWVASAVALRMTGVRHYATLDDLYAAMNIKLGNFSAISLPEASRIMTKLGATVRTTYTSAGKGAAAIDADLLRVVQQNPNSVITFAVSWRTGGKDVAHMMVAAQRQGKLIIVNRPGEVGRLQAVQSIKDLDRVHPGISTGQLDYTANVVEAARVVTSPRAAHHVVADVGEAAKALGVLGLIALEVKALPVLMRSEMPTVMY